MKPGECGLGSGRVVSGRGRRPVWEAGVWRWGGAVHMGLCRLCSDGTRFLTPGSGSLTSAHGWKPSALGFRARLAEGSQEHTGLAAL